MASFFMRFPGGAARALTLSYDDGVEQDIRLAAILDRHGLKCTFNLNSGLYAPEGTVYPAGQIHRRMTRAQVTALLAGSGHEAAVHGLTHPFLEQLPGAAAAYEVLRDRENLEAQFGGIVRGMAYPFGTTSDSLTAALGSLGIAYARTTRATEGFGLPTDWLRLDPTCHHNCPRLMDLAEDFLAPVGDRGPRLFYLWGHSYEFEAHDNWQVIEDFAARMGGRTDVWYATNIQVYDYVTAFGQLIASADGRRVHNPTALTLFASFDGQPVVLAPGRTAALD